MTDWSVLREESRRDGDRRGVYYVVSAPRGGIPFTLPMQWNPEMEIILCHAAGTAECNGVRVRFQRGDMLFFNAEYLHAVRAEDLGSFDVVLIHPGRIGFSEQDAAAGELSALVQGRYAVPVHFPAEAPVTARLRSRFAQLWSMRDNGNKLAERGAVYSLLGGLVEGRTPGAAPAPGSSDAVKRAMAFMQQHLREPLTLSDIAASAALSKYHFVRVFSQYLNATPMEYLHELRMNRAKSLLLEGRGVTNAAVSCGMPNISYFIRRFKESEGMTPLQWVKKGAGREPNAAENPDGNVPE